MAHVDTALANSYMRAIAEFVDDFIQSNGYCPTSSEIGKHIGCTGSLVMHYARRMRTLGIIDFVDGQTRTIHLVKEDKNG